ncbi:MAG: SH3 domain-containing protein [Bacteroidales bacterium]|nr:SH3 domain-containing protein [Bacteroidales bacterium]
MAKTNAWLVEYAKAQVGRPYWYGSHGQIADASLYKSLKQSYPSYYTASDFASQYGKKVHDCSGLVKGALWCDSVNGTPTYKASQDLSSSSMYSKATTKGKISTFDKVNGRLVFKGDSETSIHHVGVYCTDGYVYEAKGHTYGVLQTKFVSSEWNYWAQHPDFTADGTSIGNSGTSSSDSGTKVEAAQSGPDNSISGTYTVTASPSLNIRYGPSKNYDVRTKVAKGGTVQNYGYYSTTNGVRWLYVIANGLKGYASSEYLQKSSSSSGSTSTTSSLPTYKVGSTYKIQASRLAVRTSPEVKNNPSNRKAKSQLTDDGKKHADSEGYLLKGTSVTCKATRTNNGEVWMQIPSGWVAAYYDGQKYIS